MKENSKSLLPLAVTIIICSIIILLVHKWSQKNADTHFNTQPKIQQIEPLVKNDISGNVGGIDPLIEEQEILQSQANRIDELIEQQYQTYSEHAQAQESEAPERSRYNIYPSTEELQKMKESKALVY